MSTPQLSLKIESAAVSPDAANLTPPSWPPPNDFPIVVDINGAVVSRYGDPTWDLTPWSGYPATLNFGDSAVRKGCCTQVSSGNGELFRQVVAWWLFGERPVVKAATIYCMYTKLRPLFVLCSEQGILASELTRYPRVADLLTTRIMRSACESALTMLHELHAAREHLGFTLLDKEGLRRMEAALPEHENRQTAYIPPRIWLYQVGRLRTFLDDFNAHREGIEACYMFCLEAYASNYGSLSAACTLGRRPKGRLPFDLNTSRGKKGRFYGHFSDIAERFGIADLLSRWCLPPGEVLSKGDKVSVFRNYFTQVGIVGTAYLLNHSGMRIHESQSLRADCMQIEQDERFGRIYLLRGETSKTSDDDDALWVTSALSQAAVDAMSCVARLRMVAAAAAPEVPASPSEISNPYLVLRSYEPWGIAKKRDRLLQLRSRHSSYDSWPRISPNLFDSAELRITDADLNLARLINPSLDPERFAVGLTWPLAWHQIRRSLAVNMTASGLVSDASLQLQLKHSSRAMSLYYGQGYSNRRLNKETRNEYIRTAYEMLGKQVEQLFSDRHVSPLGAKHKANLLNAVSSDDHRAMLVAAKKGHISYRETLLGGCMRKGACPFGGIDNIVRCAGGDGGGFCSDALLDRSKRPAIGALHRVIESQLIDAPVDSPLRTSLEAQLRSVENTLNVLTP